MDFDSIYSLYFNDVFLYSRGLTSSEDVAEEITQETFFKALKSLDRFDGTKDIRAWLFTIAKNTYYTHYKRHKLFADKELDDSIADNVNNTCIVDSLIDADNSFLIHKYLHSMNEPYKEVFSLRVFGELSFEKIGMLFGKSSGWARVTFHRAKLQIKEYMEEIDNGKE